MKPLSVTILSMIIATAYVSPAAAQEVPRTLGSYSTEMSFQYSILHDYGETGPYGMQMDFGKAITKRLSLIGEFNVHRFTDAEETYTQAAFGARFGHMLGSKARLFFQVLAGPQNSWGATGYVIQPGAGINIRLSRSFDTKIQVDFPVLRWEGATYNQARVSFGVGLPFGIK